MKKIWINKINLLFIALFIFSVMDFLHLEIHTPNHGKRAYSLDFFQHAHHENQLVIEAESDFHQYQNNSCKICAHIHSLKSFFAIQAFILFFAGLALFVMIHKVIYKFQKLKFFKSRAPPILFVL